MLKISTHVPAGKEQSVSKGLPFSWNSAVPQADALQRSRVEKRKRIPSGSGLWLPGEPKPSSKVQRGHPLWPLEPAAAAGALGGVTLSRQACGAHRQKKATSTSLRCHFLLFPWSYLMRFFMHKINFCPLLSAFTTEGFTHTFVRFIYTCNKGDPNHNEGCDGKIQREAESRQPSRLRLDAADILCRNVEAPFIQSAISSQILICCWENRTKQSY